MTASGWYRHRAVARQEHVDPGVQRRAGLGQPPQRPGERVDHVGQPARLGPRLAFRGQHRDPHRHRPMLRRGGITPTSWAAQEPLVHVPVAPGGGGGGLLPPAAQAGRPPQPRLQHVVELAPAGPDPVPAHRRRRLAAPPQPHPLLGLARSTGRSCSTTRRSWPRPTTTTCWPSSSRTCPTARTTGSSAGMPGARGADRLFLRRVRPPRVAGHLLRAAWACGS